MPVKNVIGGSTVRKRSEKWKKKPEGAGVPSNARQKKKATGEKITLKEISSPVEGGKLGRPAYRKKPVPSYLRTNITGGPPGRNRGKCQGKPSRRENL